MSFATLFDEHMGNAHLEALKALSTHYSVKLTNLRKEAGLLRWAAIASHISRIEADEEEEEEEEEEKEIGEEEEIKEKGKQPERQENNAGVEKRVESATAEGSSLEGSGVVVLDAEGQALLQPVPLLEEIADHPRIAQQMKMISLLLRASVDRTMVEPKEFTTALAKELSAAEGGGKSPHATELVALTTASLSKCSREYLSDLAELASALAELLLLLSNTITRDDFTLKVEEKDADVEKQEKKKDEEKDDEDEDDEDEEDEEDEEGEERSLPRPVQAADAIKNIFAVQADRLMTVSQRQHKACMTVCEQGKAALVRIEEENKVDHSAHVEYLNGFSRSVLNGFAVDAEDAVSTATELRSLVVPILQFFVAAQLLKKSE